MNTTSIFMGFGRPWEWDEAAWVVFSILAAYFIGVVLVDWIWKRK